MRVEDVDSQVGPVRVLQKAMGLLDLLARHGDLSAAELAEMSHEPRTTVYRLMASMTALGVVDQGPTRGTFRVGIKMVEIGSSLLARLDERQLAQDPMRTLHEDTGETVYLCMRNGDRAVCIERIDGRWVRSMALRLGASLPLHIGAAPMVLLAFEPREEWNRYVADHELVGETTPTVLQPADFLADLERTRERGYAISDGGTVAGLAGVAAPVYDYSGRVRVSLGISGLSEGLLGEHTEISVRAVTQAASTVSRALGHRPTPVPRDL
jgi:DNA-binding IclR family transcriptional regulator